MAYGGSHPTTHYVSLVLLGLNSLLFMAFLAASIARYTLYPEIFPLMLKHKTMSLQISTFPVGYVGVPHELDWQPVGVLAMTELRRLGAQHWPMVTHNSSFPTRE
jgi:tellurite resistance protein TehA-like permease